MFFGRAITAPGEALWEYLWIWPDAGPNQPNPEAIVLISTCFQQQYGPVLRAEHSGAHSWPKQADSNIMSERIRPRLTG
jgi:hypothetical protein